MMESSERIILKSIELFTRYGIRLVTMDQIAEEVGTSKRTIYELFKDKDTLVMECLESIHRKQMTEIQEIAERVSNVIEALYRVGQYSEKKKAEMNPIFFEDIRKLYPQIWNTMKQRSNTGSGMFSHMILTKGIGEGIFRDDLDITIVGTFMQSMMETFHKKEIFPENTPDKALLRNIVIPYYMGISTDKGKKLIEQYIPLTFS